MRRLGRRVRLVIPLALLVLAAFPVASSQTAPSGVHIAYGSDAASDVAIAWTGSSSSGVVQYGPTTAYGLTATASTIATGGLPPLAATARLTGLTPGREYHYRIVEDNQPGADHTFHTIAHDAANVTITAFGDQGVPDATNPHGEADGDAPARTSHLVKDLHPDAHLLLGDMSYANGDPHTWDLYFQQDETFAATIPMMTTVGNHEREGGAGFRQYDARTAMPSSGDRWYAARIGPVTLISLDTEHACTGTALDESTPGDIEAACGGTPDPGQLAFLETALKSRANGTSWTIVIHHYPAWSDGPHGGKEYIRQAWGTLYERYGVDLVLQGHDHVYERTKPLIGENEAKNGTVYATVGTGGGTLYDFQSGTAPARDAFRENKAHGALLLKITNETLVSEFHTVDGHVIDTFTLSHGADVAASPSPVPRANPTQTPWPPAAIALAVILGLVFQRRRIL